MFASENDNVKRLKKQLGKLKLSTVCQEARYGRIQILIGWELVG